jgi:hypothetical protein
LDGLLASLIETIRKDENFVARGDLLEFVKAYNAQGRLGKAWIRWAAAWMIRNGPFGMTAENTARGTAAGVTTSLRKVLGPIGRRAWEAFLWEALIRWETAVGAEEVLSKLGPRQKSLGGPYPRFSDENARKPDDWGKGVRGPLERKQWIYGDDTTPKEQEATWKPAGPKKPVPSEST